MENVLFQPPIVFGKIHKNFLIKSTPNKQLTMDKIYHGCTIGYLDGLHLVIKKMKNVLFQPPIVFGKIRKT